MTGLKQVLRAALVAGLATVSAGAVSAQDASAAFYKGKTVRFTVGLGVGGGFDAYARMIAPYLSKELDTTVIVENLPGAGGLLALNQIATGPADGLRVLIVNGTPAALGQLLDQDNIRYDLTKVDHLGVISAYPWIWLMSPKSEVKTVEEAMKPGVKIRWGGTGPSDGPADGAALTCHALKLDCQIVLGYKSSGDIALAMERGEMDGLYLSDSSAANYVKNGQARAIAAMGHQRSALLPDVPTIFEQMKLTPDQEWWFTFRENLNDLGRILITTPGVPAERIAFLRAAVKRALTNPELMAEGEKTQRFVAYQPPEKALEMTRKVLSGVTPEQKKTIRDVVFKNN
ncbi:MAG: Tripartite-type tricarboxylate transporter, receptor component TctC [Hyphomicrobiales bacterium]|nr:Tripartite-type tricarboxylate transporter, receptor component TctC [Hyphomicrobiales bacterium]